ncbi:hypothetical protein BDY21DRAFT_290855 [Lineolata rhizophorae]|uniref:Gylcosyl hydrolase 115 C-terminal domain-containing protein n=1 Tax=Lineolata rhizophorae TaxID=578093 RepID=A0A6A6NT46_9PEZI|nr:hypothetical protein BDY21DRAFT_290855 [Lineolata rhizophorae]
MQLARSLLSVAAPLFAASAAALGQERIVAFEPPAAGGYALTDGSQPVQIVVDQGDWPGVQRAAGDLAADFGRVTGLNGSVLYASGGSDAAAAAAAGVVGADLLRNGSASVGSAAADPGVIIVGTLGKSALVDAMAQAGLVDASEIEGEWESFVTQIVYSSDPDAGSALVVAGSDKRGTIYGLYDISEQIGVSPWYFMADVPAQSHDAVYVTKSKVQGPPSVKYRGFFINDESPSLTGWINANYPEGEYGPGFNFDFYKHVFELLLRLRANYLWPAMWNSMFNVDDPRNQPMADSYGIVMGTSHTEPMMRATKEWSVLGEGEWAWDANSDGLRPFFFEGAERAKGYESLFTVGMRGVHDTAMSDDVQTGLLETVVDAQRDILADVYEVDDSSAIPQMWCLYKEVQAYYEQGMRVPDDVTLLWADDNWGSVRRLPTGDEIDRPGGAGVYYHFDYVGDPRDYKWINTVQLQKTWEQMHLTYERNARQIWIVNVGDIKPKEIPITHFFDIAYDFTRWSHDSVPEWTAEWASLTFGSDYAEDIADVVNRYGKLAIKRKYELVDSTTYSIINYEEAESLLAEWKSLSEKAQGIYDQLTDAWKPAFFETILHPVLAGATVYDIHISSAKNNLYASQGRNSANMWADYVLELFDRDHDLTVQYHTLLNSKWEHMMDQTHLGYEYWQQPMRQQTPALKYVQTKERSLRGDLGVSVEGSNASVPGDDQWHDLSSNTLSLPPIDPYGPSRWIEIYSTGVNPVSWTISAEPFVVVSQAEGTLSGPDGDGDMEVRVELSIDWDSAPDTFGETTINISSSADYGTQFSMPQVVLPYNSTAAPTSFAGHVESDAHVSIEAEHFAGADAALAEMPAPDGEPGYLVLPGYGRHLSGVELVPAMAPSLAAPAGPHLAYPFYTFAAAPAGDGANLTLFLAPSLNYIAGRPLRYAVQIDGQDVREVGWIEDRPDGALPVGWERAVADGAWASVTGNWSVAPGEHVLRYWALEPGVVLMKAVLDLGGVRESYLGPPESVMV